ncbi:Hippocampus abundant transcript 1 protein [Schistosoma japonicum]|nr:Hippocampus abundant transcript 1 protein [Schistosoma japonicum]
MISISGIFEITFSFTLTYVDDIASAGLLAAIGSIKYTGLSTFVSTDVAAGQQGVTQTIIIDAHGSCGKFEPTVFGLFFYILRVNFEIITSTYDVTQGSSICHGKIKLLNSSLLGHSYRVVSDYNQIIPKVKMINAN